MSFHDSKRMSPLRHCDAACCVLAHELCVSHDSFRTPLTLDSTTVTICTNCRNILRIHNHCLHLESRLRSQCIPPQRWYSPTRLHGVIFICCLFNDIASNPDCTESNEWITVNKWFVWVVTPCSLGGEHFASTQNYWVFGLCPSSGF
jgi:hypothetical protein